MALPKALTKALTKASAKNEQQVNSKQRSIQLRVLLSFIMAAACIVFLGLGLGGRYVSEGVDRAIEHDFVTNVGLCDDLVSLEISILKKDATFIAQRISQSPTMSDSLLEEEMAHYDNFFALTVLDRQSVLAAAGKYSTSENLLDESYLQCAFNGEAVISTTRLEDDGTLTMHVCAPIDKDHVLSATIDGLYFQRVLERSQIWESGYIFLFDDTGTLIACANPEWVKERREIDDPLLNNSLFTHIEEAIGSTNTHAIPNTLVVLDGSNVIAYRTVTFSILGWVIGTTAPTSESQIGRLHQGLFITGIVCLICAVLGAFVAAVAIGKPYREVEQHRREAIEANEAKSLFLANMSHEMRTPLNAIIGLTELALTSDELNEKVRPLAENVYSSGVTLLGLVNDILDHSKAQAGKLELVPVDYDMSSLINDTVVLNSVRIGSKPIEFKLDIAPNLPSRLFGDDLRVRQVLNNLLSNAFKYTDEGTVILSFSCEREGDFEWLTISVADTGIGIEPEQTEKLFGIFCQLDPKSNRHIEGTGLGLSLAKQLAELMDGWIKVESKHGLGSVFTVRLRQHHVTDTVIGAEVISELQNAKYTESKRERMSKLIRTSIPYARVLVVDDVEANLDVAKGLMRPYDMQIDTAKSGESAVELVRKASQKYNAIFMDHMMPGMDGIEAVRVIREEIDSDYARTIPIIALTANVVAGNKEIFLSSGFQAFLSKPVDIIKLDAVINQFVRDRQLERELAAKRSRLSDAGNADSASKLAEREVLAATAEAKQDNTNDRRAKERRSGSDRRRIAGVDIVAGLQRFGGDEEAYWDVVASYTTHTPKLLDDLACYLTAGDLANYAVTVHGIKGSSRAIAADQVGLLAEELERAAKAGQLDLVGRLHKPFAQQVRTLFNEFNQEFDKALKKSEALAASKFSKRKKLRLDRPPVAVLSALFAAAQDFDIDGVDTALRELDAYEYTADGGLVLWLHEQVALMGFKKITERLSAELNLKG